MLAKTIVGNLIFSGDRVLGVKGTRNNSVVEYRAGKEVILAMGATRDADRAGAVGHRQRQALANAGVEMRVESPNVGEKMLDHRGITLRAKLNPGLGYNKLLSSMPRS
ncbi:hypothetical protein [Rhodococcus sp. ACS1]|uniref:hypothetical protein n=1 Tax=Rhodococcus sp. ACS1 TaxID=2028570 RepID=UPI0015CBEF5B